MGHKESNQANKQTKISYLICIWLSLKQWPPTGACVSYWNISSYNIFSLFRVHLDQDSVQDQGTQAEIQLWEGHQGWVCQAQYHMEECHHTHTVSPDF